MTFERFTIESERERRVKVCRNHVRSVSLEEDVEREMCRRERSKTNEFLENQCDQLCISCIIRQARYHYDLVHA